MSIDCKATVPIGDVSRGGRTRGDYQACDHDLGLKEKYIPCGILEEDRGQLHITFGSSYKTSDFIVDALEAWWAALETTAQVAMARLQITRDNGPESSGRRTQFLQRMVTFCDAIGKPIQLLYYPPYHSKYNPIERCWGILERSYWIPGSSAPTVSEKRAAFLRPLNKKGFQEERVAKGGVDDLGISTTLESNKSLPHTFARDGICSRRRRTAKR